jgi:serine/threonine-protein kinase
MPPEQWRGGLVESRGDVYALGCVLFEAMTGAPPFDGALVQLANAHYFRAPTLLSRHRPDVPAALEELVDAMLAKEVVDRPGMAEVANALRALAPRRQRVPAIASNAKYW